MARYIDADRLMTKIHELYVQPNIELWQVVKCVGNSPSADVVPKSEYDALAEKNESLEIELENMRCNLGDAREGWNDAECEVERLRKALDAYEETSGLKKAKAEVAREIFEEIEEYVIKGISVGGEHLTLFNGKNFAELKKKYTEENQT